MKQKFTIITGHYGCGKSNFAVNMAIESAKSGQKVTLFDMDLVNPYFRSSDYGDLLKEYDIEVIAPVYAGTNVDLPSLPPEIYSIFLKEGHIIIDVGGDDVGATVMGRFYERFAEVSYDMIYLINRYRSLTTTPEEACEILKEIEQVSRLKATHIVNNSHLKNLTTVEDIENSLEFANKTAELLQLPLLYTTVPRCLQKDLSERLSNLEIYPVDIYVKTVWE